MTENTFSPSHSMGQAPGGSRAQAPGPRRFTRHLIRFLRWELLILLSGLFVIYLSHEALKNFKSPSAQVYFVSPSPYLDHFTFGYKELVADLLWIRALQDFSECDRPIKSGELCNNSWAFRMVDKVTDLSPHFRMVYATIPILLSVLINDQEGALRLLDKGLKYYPQDWPILYRGGYLYLFDQDNKEKAAELFIRSQKNGGPEWLASFATRLYTQAGKRELAEKLVKEYESSPLSPEILQRMKDQILKKSK